MEPRTFLTYSLGCRVNQAEIEETAKQLVVRGFVPWSKFSKSPKFPNLVLINTCVVTQKAERETRREIRRLKKSYPKAFLVVLGCGVNAHQKLKINLPEASLLISNQEKSKVGDLILKNQFDQLDKLAQLDKYSSSGRKLLKIQDGCNQFCAFCIVPYLRGKSKSKAPTKIVGEIKKLSNLEIKEIILTGINLSLYGQDLKPKTNLVELLKKTLKETKVHRISLSSLTPEVINKEFVNLYLNDWKKGKGRLSRYWHLALQSGSPQVLEKMGRKTNLKSLIPSLQSIKVKVPEFVFRADFLVGFPGETEKDFQLTLQLIKVAKITFSHVFPFSKRPGTTAYKMIKKGIWKDLSSQVKKERVKQVIAETRKVRYREARKLVGKILPCLFLNKKDDYWQTLADNSWPVRVKSLNPNSKGSVTNKGQIKKVKITEARTDYLLGEILSFPT